MAYIKSWYADSVGELPERAKCTESMTVDVAVIGGGMTGCSAAYHLAQAGHSIALLEAEKIGWGASGRNGGQFIFGYACDPFHLMELMGAEMTRQLWDLSLAAVQLTRNLITQHHIDCDLTNGMAHVAIKPRHELTLKKWHDLFVKNYAYSSMQWLDQSNLRDLLASTRYLSALYDANSGHLHPLKYTLGLARAAEQKGVLIFEHSPVANIKRGQLITLQLANGAQVHCRQLVLAGNAYLSQVLMPEINAKIMPVGTYIIATKPLPNATALIRNNMAIADMNFVLDYFRLTPDHRLLFGGLASYSTAPPSNVATVLLKQMKAVFPSLHNLSLNDITHCWGGNVAVTLNRMPHVGRIDDNIYFAQGFSGHGVALTGLTGQVMAEAISGTLGRFDLFSQVPHQPFPGGRRLRLPAIMLGNLFYRLRDYF
ncbi:NAD(P)/FAD-dependent oxidoreductase [Thioflexithrix psekupsensis]|uniref:NAD(P)/FAD-dependent oxidoreductase n=1 Tax=Thioflexithrix psekupsensis TaxID=1570016 RepID=UPI001C3D022D|nr:FAD-binding oxidoreductase [Thioflexithrix psekupsensis]